MSNSGVLRIVDAHNADLAGIGVSVRLPESGERPPDLKNDTISFFGKLAVISCASGVEFGICAYRRRELIVDGLEQHKRSAELLYAVDDDFLMPVAPNLPGADMPDLARAFAVRVRRSEGILFEPGAWHWIPYPVSKEESFALVSFALDTPSSDMATREMRPPLRMQA